MTLAQDLGNKAKGRGVTISLAESITGGLCSDLITNVPGSSGYFLGAVICYSNSSKVELLGVKEATIAYQGAVSEQCALEMAVGVRNRFHSNLGVSVTGIAGPGGERPGKPVGLVYFGVDDGDNIWTERMLFEGDREAIKRSAAEHLIGLIIKALG